MLSPSLAFFPGFSTPEELLCLSPQALQGGPGDNMKHVPFGGAE